MKVSHIVLEIYFLVYISFVANVNEGFQITFLINCYWYLVLWFLYNCLYSRALTVVLVGLILCLCSLWFFCWQSCLLQIIVVGFLFFIPRTLFSCLLSLARSAIIILNSKNDNGTVFPTLISMSMAFWFLNMFCGLRFWVNTLYKIKENSLWFFLYEKFLKIRMDISFYQKFPHLFEIILFFLLWYSNVSNSSQMSFW